MTKQNEHDELDSRYASAMTDLVFYLQEILPDKQHEIEKLLSLVGKYTEIAIARRNS